MRILQSNKLYPPHLGGMENTVRDIAEALVKAGWTSDVLACQEKGPRIVQDLNGVRVYRASSFGRLFSLPISFDYLALFKKLIGSYDILLIHQPFPLASVARFLLAPKDFPVAVYYHSDIIRQKFLYYLVYPFLYQDLKAAKIIFVGSRRLAENSPLLSKFLNKCQVIPFAVDAATYQRDCSSEVAALREKYGRFMLAVGRLVYYKGYLGLVEAMRRAPGRLVVIGSGPLEKKMRDMIDYYHLADRVFIISDHPADLLPYYQACEFLVFPSNARSEAFGLVQLEAMACGKPVINTDLPTGVPEVSRHGESGLTVPPDDSVALAAAISSLWTDEARCREFGAAALKRVQDIFSRDKFLSDLAASLFKLNLD